MSYRIRSVEKRDEDEWVELRHALYGDDVRVHADEVRRFFDGTASEPRAVLVAVDSGGNVLGFAELSIHGYAEGCSTSDVAYLEGWYVRPDARRCGIGRALVAAAEEWARSEGSTELASDTVVDNLDSARAHEACGFAEVSRLRCFRKALGDGLDQPTTDA